MHLSNYVKIYPYPEEPGYSLLFSTKSAATVLLHESTVRSIEEGTLSSADEETLLDLGFLVPDREKEKRGMLDVVDEGLRGVKEFSAMVVLNLACNLACTYCYEGSLKGTHYLSHETADLLIDLLEKHIAAGEDIHLDFYGGEPLLSLDLMRHISGRVKSSAEQCGVQYAFNLITNGTLLTKGRVEELKSLGLKGAKVTLDGLRENHDRFRPFKSGAGSFDVIVKNVKDVCGMIDIQIGGNYDRDNYREFSHLLDHLIKEGITPDRVSIVKFTPITRTGGEFSLPEFTGGCASINEPWLFEASLFLREEILKRGFYTQKVTPSMCMIESPHDLVINFDGTFYKCPAFIGWKELEVGHLSTGVKEYRASHNLDVWKKQECLDCAYLPICYGGCRHMRLLREGNIDDVDCKRPYLDATLEAFIRQDIRYRSKTDR